MAFLEVVFMGANSTQAVAIVLFLIGFTLLAGGLAGGGVILLAAALILIGAAAFFFMKCKPSEQNE
jgi:hypothetical protein